MELRYDRWVLSPLLANIYLHELDTFVQDELIPKWNIGKKRKRSSQYQTLMSRKNRAKKRNDQEAVKKWTKAIRQIPSQDMFDPLIIKGLNMLDMLMIPC